MFDDASKEAQNDTTGERLEALGLKLTKIYFIIMAGAFPFLFHFGVLEWSPMTLNEVGDFLAGVFGPLAIFWLVLGFFQQGRELRQSAKALTLQAHELKNSVEQQREIVENTHKALRFEVERYERERATRKKAIEPDFNVSFKHYSRATGSLGYRADIVNAGHKIRNLVCEVHHDEEITPKEHGLLKTGESTEISFTRNQNDPIQTASVHLTYTDDDGHTETIRKNFRCNGINANKLQQFIDCTKE